ncbi:MAG: hypothetical protein M1401_02910 [Chloroflexi bacterium]|nr:hypothetical protein [Chloroflexota bacterium]MCL5107825.1 hypothetical protein [Chloroflexota bacterium]
MGGKGSALVAVMLVCALGTSACASPLAGSPPTSTPAAPAPPARAGTAISFGPIKWNAQDPNANSNGNARLVAAFLKTADPTKLRQAADNVTPSALAKAPWDYYGKPLRLRGQVLRAQDLPHGGQTARDLGVDQVGELLLVAEDGTRLNYTHLGSVGAIKAGAKVYVCGYAVGLVPQDTVGLGKPSVPVLVGRSIES